MKNCKAFLKFTIIILVLTAFGFAGAAFAKTVDSYITLNPQSKILTNKIMTVSFDNQLKENTVNTQNIYVRDSSNKNVAVNVRLDSSKKIILIEPVKKYDYGKTYTIYVKKSVKYEAGRHLKNGIKMSFTTISKGDYADLSLPALGSIDKLRQLVEENKNKVNGFELYLRGNIINGASASMSKINEDAKKVSANDGSSEYSLTNVQVQGVDEGDTVKTDGQYIYKITGNKLFVIRVLKDNKMQIADAIDYSDKNYTANELYIDSKYLVVIGSFYDEVQNSTDNAVTDKISGIKPYYLVQRQITKVVVYDLSDRDHLKQLREIDVEGNYVSSRKIGSKLYVVSNKYMDLYCVEKGMKEAVPVFRDSAFGNEFSAIGFDKIRYFPDSIDLNYLVTAGIDLDDPKKPVCVCAYLGAGNTVFVSLENVYISINKFSYTPVKDIKVPANTNSNSVSVKSAVIGRAPVDANTLVYKFNLDSGNIYYVDKAEIPGTVLNQFSMDENKGYLRIATTTGQTWWGSSEKSQNNLYILDSSMNISGKIEGLAPGEKIYSSRFIGDRGYIVTYKKVDPLFVIDLKNPEEPKVIGYLKIPGYSQYLHPYDENHIIGIGKDSIEIPGKSGGPDNSRAFYLGLKAAIFDITDVRNPKEMFVEKIGDRGTDSEALYDHKAFLFSKDKNLLAFPVSLYELDKGQSILNTENGYPEYGRFTFQGAYVYDIDLVNGFRLKGTITHYNSSSIDEKENYPYDDMGNINRIIYIGNTLYTISNGMIKAVDINDLQEKDKIVLP